jgi:uncharacterized protein YutE (UPF0331/DUF86 family)
MTPRRLDWETVAAKLRSLRESLDDLESVGEVSVELLREDRIVRAAVERLLSRVVDLAIDVNTHVAVARLERAPTDYRSSFALAAGSGLVGPELARGLAASVGLGKVIVHDCLEPELDRVAQAVPLAITGYGEFVRVVASELRAQRDE